jgi:transitional endoplasmic reticulum ATPase
LDKILELHLKVKEAKYRDVGKGIARISKKNMKELGVLPGDVVELQGQDDHKTTVLIWPAYFDDEDDLIISIDATTRTNAGVRLDEVVVIRKGTTLPAAKVVLVPTTNYVLKGVESFFYQKFQNRTVSLNDKIRLEYMGQRIEYQVAKLTPNRDSVFINEQTIIEARKSPHISDDVTSEVKLIPKISYEDIGGIDDTIQRVREMVELPMM